jgi:uncharacterized membrane protein
MSQEHTVHYPPHAKGAFPHDALERISKTIAEIEEVTSAEIRISIRDTRETSEAGLTIKELAEKEFLHLGMHKTSGQTGILLFILYDERKFYVMGDEGVHKRSAPETWEDVASTLKTHFKQAQFEEGVHAALKRIKHHVRQTFPSSGPSAQELSNEVTIS